MFRLYGHIKVCFGRDCFCGWKIAHTRQFQTCQDPVAHWYPLLLVLLMVGINEQHQIIAAAMVKLCASATFVVKTPHMSLWSLLPGNAKHPLNSPALHICSLGHWVLMRYSFALANLIPFHHLHEWGWALQTLQIPCNTFFYVTSFVHSWFNMKAPLFMAWENFFFHLSIVPTLALAATLCSALLSQAVLTLRSLCSATSSMSVPMSSISCPKPDLSRLWNSKQACFQYFFFFFVGAICHS